MKTYNSVKKYLKEKGFYHDFLSMSWWAELGSIRVSEEMTSNRYLKTFKPIFDSFIKSIKNNNLDKLEEMR